MAPKTHSRPHAQDPSLLFTMLGFDLASYPKPTMKHICQCCSVNMASHGDKVGIHILFIGLAAKESILLSFCLWGRNSKVLPPMKNETSLDTEPVTA